jgi:hypothetical protein
MVPLLLPGVRAANRESCLGPSFLSVPYQVPTTRRKAGFHSKTWCASLESGLCRCVDVGLILNPLQILPVPLWCVPPFLGR